jgi:hypothetical protein
MGMSGYSKLAWTLWDKTKLPMTQCEVIGQILKEQGYRKASDVAREIEEIIDEEINVFEKARIDLYPRQDSYYAGVFVKSLSEIKEKLKKKYESEGENR